MKIIASDTSTSHGDWMKSLIQEICPEAYVEVRVESLMDSVNYAIANGFDGICRPTTGLSDSRIANEGKLAFDNGIWIVHANGSNSNIELTGASHIGEIIVARGTSTSFGNGVEFTIDVGTESEATGKLAGMMAKLLVDHPSWNFLDARQALRRTASNWDTGWNKNAGFGIVSLDDANNVLNLGVLNSIYNVQVLSGNQSIDVSFDDFVGYGEYAVVAYEAFNLNSDPDLGIVLYEGFENNISIQHNLSGDYFIEIYVKSNGAYSRTELFAAKEETLYDVAMPEVDFTADNPILYEPSNIQFTAIIDGDYDSVEWDFGDGATSNALNPVHYYDYGVYDVVLTVYYQGFSKKAIRYGYIEIRKIDFEVLNTIGHAPFNVLFNNLSVGQFAEIEWGFGDGSFSNDFNTEHIYEKSGFYSPTLTITFSDGDVKTITKPNIINVLEDFMAKLSDVLPEIAPKKVLKADHIQMLIYAITGMDDFEDSTLSALAGNVDIDGNYMSIDFENTDMDFDFSGLPKFEDYFLRVVKGELDVDGNYMDFDFNKTPLALEF